MSMTKAESVVISRICELKAWSATKVFEFVAVEILRTGTWTVDS